MLEVMKKSLLVISFLVLIPSLILNAYFLFFKQDQLKKVLVIDVIDGDTFVIEGKKRVRLMGVYAPEDGLCGSEEATEKLKELVDQKQVAFKDLSADTFGRIVATVYQGNVFVNKVMLADGLARYDNDSSSTREELKAVYEQARKDKLGIFSEKCYQTENKENPQCNIKGNFNKKTGTKIYHLPDCNEYKTTVVELDVGDQWFCTEKQAKEAGFIKAQNCP